MSDRSTPRPSPSDPLARSAEPLFDAERLDCYRVALEFQNVAVTFVPRRGYAALRDQLERASVSIVLNIAEAVGRFSPAERAHFLGIARGSATECAALVDIAVARGLASSAAGRHARGLLLRLVQMLTRFNQSLAR